MGQLTPRFLIDLETRMRIIANTEYSRLTSALWYKNAAKEMPMTGMRERLVWLLDTARIEYVNKFGGEITFEDILSNTVEYESKAATAGLKLNRAQLDDHDGGGVQLAAQWTRQITAQGAYWPQKQIAKLINAGDQSGSTAYDGQLFFSGSHPLNPFDSTVGNYSNILTGGASGSYPGACPIDAATVPAIDTAFNNLAKAITYVSTFKMPNGEDPRMLKVKGLLVPPALVPRAQQLTNARYIAQAASSGGAAGDIEAVIRNWGLAQPIEGTELGSAFTNGSDTSYYLLIEQAGSDELGALNYMTREQFSIVFNGEMNDAQLARANELQWFTRGRNVATYGHPYLMIKVKAT
jgi:phage major head subunit gpT-like protein